MGRDLHGLRLTLHVHEDHPGAGLPDHGEHLRVPGPRDVVHDQRTGIEGGPGHGRLPRVDRDGNGDLRGERLDHGGDAVPLLLGRDRIRSRTGRLAADVDEVGALVDHLDPTDHGSAVIEVQPPVGEGVGRDVQDAHDEGPLAAVDLDVSDAPDGFATHGTHASPKARTGPRAAPYVQSFTNMFPEVIVQGSVLSLVEVTTNWSPWRTMVVR